MKRANFFKIPFNLELAKMITNKEVNGKIVTQDGHNARIVCFDYKRFVSINSLLALIDCGDQELALAYNDKGKEKDNRDKYDLHLEIPSLYCDYSNFVPTRWQPCMVRKSRKDTWGVQVFSEMHSSGNKGYFFTDDGDEMLFEIFLPLNDITKQLKGDDISYEDLIEKLDEEYLKQLKKKQQ